jgi:hypothetical protein
MESDHDNDDDDDDDDGRGHFLFFLRFDDFFVVYSDLLSRINSVNRNDSTEAIMDVLETVRRDFYS